MEVRPRFRVNERFRVLLAPAARTPFVTSQLHPLRDTNLASPTCSSASTSINSSISNMASHLEKLPPELLLQIAGYIPRPSDLKALCLASKALRTCALPSLYEAISLDSSASWVPETDKGLLHIGNPGLPYVRRLIIAANGEQDGNAERRFLRLFLSVLPRDQLFEM